MADKDGCPRCGAEWGLEETNLQECDACGWPDVDTAAADDLAFDDPEEFSDPEPNKK